MSRPDKASRHSGVRRRVTASDVATLAGVSRTAVSFAFNNPSQISSDTHSRILAVADELGYTPNPVARMLVKGRTNTLGVLLPQDISEVMQNPYYAQFMVGIGQVCRREGLTLLLTPPLRSSMLEAIPYAAVDGFIVCGLELDRGEVAELRRRQIPFVLVDSDAPAGVPRVDVDDQAGMREITAHVLGLGHRRIAVLAFAGGPDTTEHGYRGTLARRMAGIADALGAVDMTMEDITVVHADTTRSDGYSATIDLLTDTGRPRPTAVIALSDILAIGAMDAARELDVSVPESLSICGFDDQPEAAWVRPRLTTVRQPIVAKGRVAADFLVEALAGTGQPPQQLLSTVLVTRESTGIAPS